MRNALLLTLAMAGFASAQVSHYNTVVGGQTYDAIISVESGTPVTYLALTVTVPTWSRDTARTAPITRVFTYPPGYVEALASLDAVYSTEPARASIASVEAQATGLAGSAVTAMSRLSAAVTNPTALANPDAAKSYVASYTSIFTNLPTEVQSYQKSIDDRFISVYSQYSVYNWTLTRARDELESSRSARLTTSTGTASVLTSDLGHLTSSILASIRANATSTSTSPATVSTGGVERVGLGAAGYLAAAGAAGLGAVAVLL